MGLRFEVKEVLAAIYAERYLPDESAKEPDEGLLELIVALGRDVVVLEILLSVESDLLGLYLAVLNVDLVSDQNDGHVLTDSDQIFVPLGDVLIGDSGADVEHDDSAVSTDAKKRELP